MTVAAVASTDILSFTGLMIPAKMLWLESAGTQIVQGLSNHSLGAAVKSWMELELSYGAAASPCTLPTKVRPQAMSAWVKHGCDGTFAPEVDAESFETCALSWWRSPYWRLVDQDVPLLTSNGGDWVKLRAPGINGFFSLFRRDEGDTDDKAWREDMDGNENKNEGMQEDALGDKRAHDVASAEKSNPRPAKHVCNE